MSVYIAIALSALFFALTELLTKLGSSASPLTATLIQVGISTGICGILWLLQPALRGAGDGKSLLYLTLSGVTVSIALFLFVYALSRANVSVVAPAMRILAIVCVATFGVIFLRENITWVRAAGMLIAILGVVLMVK